MTHLCSTELRNRGGQLLLARSHLLLKQARERLAQQVCSAACRRARLHVAGREFRQCISVCKCLAQQGRGAAYRRACLHMVVCE